MHSPKLPHGESKLPSQPSFGPNLTNRGEVLRIRGRGSLVWAQNGDCTASSDVVLILPTSDVDQVRPAFMMLPKFDDLVPTFRRFRPSSAYLDLRVVVDQFGRHRPNLG